MAISYKKKHCTLGLRRQWVNDILPKINIDCYPAGVCNTSKWEQCLSQICTHSDYDRKYCNGHNRACLAV